jgi:hypothetical protein
MADPEKALVKIVSSLDTGTNSNDRSWEQGEKAFASIVVHDAGILIVVIGHPSNAELWIASTCALPNENLDRAVQPAKTRGRTVVMFGGSSTSVSVQQPAKASAPMPWQLALNLTAGRNLQQLKADGPIQTRDAGNSIVPANKLQPEKAPSWTSFGPSPANLTERSSAHEEKAFAWTAVSDDGKVMSSSEVSSKA